METPSVRICVVFHSSFRGHTSELAQCIVTGAARIPGAEASALPVEAVEGSWSVLHEADAIVFGSPTYMGSVSAGFKEFVEKLAGDVWLRRLWTNKLAAGFTVSGGLSGDKLASLSQLVIFAAQLGMIWLPLPFLRTTTRDGDQAPLCINRMSGYLGLMAQGDAAAETRDAVPADDRASAVFFGEHIALTALQFSLGRQQMPQVELGTGRVATLPPLEGRPKSLHELEAHPRRPDFRAS